MAQEQAKRDAEAKAASEKSANEKATRDAKEGKSRLKLEGLAKKKQVFASGVFQAKRAITRLQSELKNIQTLEEKALTEEWARNNRFTYAYSFVFDASKEPEEAKQERERQHLQRVANKRIKEKELSREQEKLKEWNDLLSGVEQAIAAEISNSQERAKRTDRGKEEAKRQEEAKAYKKRQEEYMERERANRAAAEARVAQERAAEERRKKEVEEEQCKLDAERLRKRREEEARQQLRLLAELLRNMIGSIASEAPNVQDRFLFQCPNCQMKSCAGCWGALEGSGGGGPGLGLYCLLGGGFSPGWWFSPREGLSTEGGLNTRGGFSSGRGFSPERGYSSGRGFNTGGRFSPGGGFTRGGGFGPERGYSSGEGFGSGYCDDEDFTYDWHY